MNYGHWTGCTLLPTDADGIISPDIFCIVHQTKAKSIYAKQILPELHIIRFQKGSAIYRYWANPAVICSSTQTRHSYLVPRAALRKMMSQNCSMGSKMNADGPQRTPVCPPRSQDAWIRLKNSHFSNSKNTGKTINYGLWTGCTLLPTDADGKVSPDILCKVHETEAKSIYSKQILP